MAGPKKKPARAASSRSGTKKTTTTKTPAKPRKKRASRKKKSGFGWPLLAGIVIGFVMACVGAWGVYVALEARPGANVSQTLNDKKPESRQKKNNAKQTPGKQRDGTPAARGTGRSGKGTAGSGQGAGQNGEKAGAAQKGAGTAGAATGMTPQQQADVLRALQDLQSAPPENLPYEESLESSFEERVRQADYAFLHAAFSVKLPASNLRFSGRDEHHHQNVDVLPGTGSGSYVSALRKSLSTWTRDASLQKTGVEEWTVYLGKTETHRLRLYPGRTDFPPPSGKKPGDGAGPSRQPDSDGQGKTAVKPTRKPGQPARLVIVIDDLGESKKAVKELLALNYPVTFAFWPFSGYAKEGAVLAHKAGREILVHYPMQPVGHPQVKAGPGVLLVGMDGGRIQALVEQGIARVPHAVGLNNHMGSRFTQDRVGVANVLAVLKRKKMFVLDSLTHGRSVFGKEASRFGVRAYKRNIFLDHTTSKAEVLTQLKKAERIALLTGHCVAIGHPHKETLSALKDWQRMRDRSVLIVRLQDIQPE